MTNTQPINDTDIAIIGLSGRFPGAPNLDIFWQNLRNGIESISFFSDDELMASGIDKNTLNHPNYVKAAPRVSDVELFDADFFNIGPKEAKIIDPQQRLFLECAWEALESAGYINKIEENIIGVYGGGCLNHYLLNNLYPNRHSQEIDGFSLIIGSEKDYLPTRISYKLNLKGPSVNVQTACSTSLVAVHLACQSLLEGECDIALAGGVAIHLPQKTGYPYIEGMVLSPDGHCRSFDAEAQGTVFGDGLGIVVLKRLEEAIADRDCIHAIVKGSAINNDGSVKIGFTAPSVEGQSKVISEAQAIAGIEADTITYIEAHGTGTSLGDPIEIEALTQAFRATTEKKGFCAIGSVKTNIGHSDNAAGMASLIKTILALKHRLLPPNLHFKQPNPKIDFANSPFIVNAALSEWKPNGSPCRAGVSSFGMGGTNAHVILEQAPEHEPSGISRPWHLLVISAKTRSALDKATTNLATYLEQHPQLNLADIAYTLSESRKAFNYRRVLVCQEINQAATALRTLEPSTVLTNPLEAKTQPVVFMFSGQGAQYPNMGQELYQNEPVFCEQIALCSEHLKPILGLDLRQILYSANEQSAQQLNQTQFAQPALFVIEYALAKLWMSYGVYPEAMIGHSIGEYVAACLANVFSLEEALSLVAARGQMMQQMPKGTMLAVSLSEEQIEPLLGNGLSLAAINAPLACVVSGNTTAINALEKQLNEQGVQSRQLHTSHAFHSEMMDPILMAFANRVKQVELKAPQMPYLSNLTGTWITADEATDPNYWAKHLRQTVRFAEGLQNLVKDSTPILLEVSPGRTLSTLAKQQLDNEPVVLSSIRHPQKQQSDISFLFNTLGKLWLAGGQVDWSGFYSHEQRYRLDLPTYPFERKRYWIDPPKALTPQVSQEHADQRLKIDDWFYLPVWKKSIPSTSSKNLPISSWLVFEDECSLGAHLVKKLRQHDHKVITVKAGASFKKLNNNEYSLNPQQRDDYDALIKELRTRQIPQRVIHLWSITSNNRDALEDIDNVQDLGFYSLLFLAQAVGKQNVADNIQITVVTNNMQATGDEEFLLPEKATVIGPVRVIGQEYPNLSCRSIDIVFPTPSNEKLINQLLTELTSQSNEQIIALRGEHRWMQTFESTRLDKSDTHQLREKGVYLITGGLGGIGFILAEHLAKTVQAKLILTGRSTFPAKEEWNNWLTTHDEDDSLSLKIKNVQTLEAQGAEVLVVSADVSHLKQMEKVITLAREQFGEINGVIHSAGVPDGALIPRQTREMIDTILDPKIKGTLVLDSLLENVELDFFFLCSSLISITGLVGQIGYCAANAFLDAFAKAKGGYFTAINWDGWQNVGMTAPRPKFSKETREVSNPLFDECLIESTGVIRYISRLNVNQHWFLDEHRLMGKAVLPGTAHLELARAAFEPINVQQNLIEIREVYFLQPLIVEDNETKEIQTFLTKQGKTYEFVISSQGQEHTRGRLASIRREPAKKHDIEAIKGRCDQGEIIIEPDFAQKPSDQLNRIEAFMKGYGPHWYNLKQVKLGTQEGLAFLELSKNVADDLTAYQLHPALLDIATAFLSLIDQSQAIYPFSYKRLTIKAPLPNKFYSFVRYANTQTGMFQFNITLMDEQGMELVDIEEYTLRLVETDTSTYKQFQAQNETVSLPENFHLQIASPGQLETLKFRPAERQQPNLDEVEIENFASGLNFKEVLYAMGLLPAPPELSIKFGLECAGKIVAIGENVKDFQIGDEVIACAQAACFSAFTNVPASFVVPKPDNLNFEASATIPTAFMTAYYALIKVGRLCKGERILIHAASGGVGLAAVQIAQWIGAEIFATAGNSEKREFLHSIGIQHVMDSRSLDFANEVMEYTEGKGVDVVLNSLGGEFISKSLEILAHLGRFLELGVRDIYNNTPLGLQPFEKCLSFTAINISSYIPQFNAIFREVVQHFNEGHFSALPYRVFSATEVTNAFEYMASAKHIGKIIVSLEEKESIKTLAAQYQPSSKTARKLSKIVDSGNGKNAAMTKEVQQSLINEGILPTEGIAVFNRILGSTSPQVIVSTRHLQSRIEHNINSLKAADQNRLAKQVHSKPRDELEQKLVEIWQSFLGIEKVGIHDDFFDLGGDSLLAFQLISKIRDALQIEISANSLLNTPTIAGLIEQNQPTPRTLPSSLVEIQTGNNLKKPLFLIHPISGNVYIYRDLTLHLEPEQPVYGIQAQGLLGEAAPLSSIEEMAAHYLEAIRVRQPEGPYYLGGSSLGGMVAFEMAQQLQALGQKVALLAMIDSPISSNQSTFNLKTNEEIINYIRGENVSMHLDELSQPQEHIHDLLNIFKQNKQAARDYKPRVYPGRIIFFRALEENVYINAKNAERAWSGFAQQGMEVIDVPGNHITMNYAPHVQVIAKRLKSCFE